MQFFGARTMLLALHRGARAMEHTAGFARVLKVGGSMLSKQNCGKFFGGEFLLSGCDMCVSQI